MSRVRESSLRSPSPRRAKRWMLHADLICRAPTLRCCHAKASSSLMMVRVYVCVRAKSERKKNKASHPSAVNFCACEECDRACVRTLVNTTNWSASFYWKISNYRGAVDNLLRTAGSPDGGRGCHSDLRFQWVLNGRWKKQKQKIEKGPKYLVLASEL